MTLRSTILHATTIVRRPAVKEERVVDTVTLDHGQRAAGHVHATTAAGAELCIELEKHARIADGDALALADGKLVRVVAAPEKLLKITAEPARLLRIAWHLGDRHVATEVAGDALYVPDDSALVETVRGLAGLAQPVMRPFVPETGGHAAAHPHYSIHSGHDHDHDHDHDHAHHDHAHHHHDHGDEHEHGHEHGHGHGHGHHHGHEHGRGHGHEHPHDKDKS